MREVITSSPLAFYDLNEDANAFIIICQFFVMTIHQRIGIQDAGIDIRNGFDQRRQPRVVVTLIRQEDTFIFPGKGSSKVIFQQTGRADDQRAGFRFGENAVEVVDDLSRKLSPGKIRAQHGIVRAHLVFGFIFLVVPMNKIIEGQEVVKNIRTKIIRNGKPEALTKFRRSCLFEHAHREQHSRRLAANLPAADLAHANIPQVFHFEPLTCDLDVLQLVANHRADEDGFQFLQTRFIALTFLRRHGFDHLRLLKKHILRRKLRVEPDELHIGIAAFRQHLADDVFKFLIRQVVSKIKIGQRIADAQQALLPYI